MAPPLDPPAPDTPPASPDRPRRIAGLTAALLLLPLAACGSLDRTPAVPDAAAELPPALAVLPWGPDLIAPLGEGGRNAACTVEIFRAADADGDGVLEPGEIEAYALARFAAADSDGDGLLDRGELGLAGLPPEAQTLPFDRDGDGRMSPAEQLAYIRTAIVETADDGSPAVEWVDVDRRLVR